MAIESGWPGVVNLAEAAAVGGAVVHRRSLTDDVYERLIELLLEAELEPGARLQIDALARVWQVSQTPIREALARAEVSGLVVRQAGVVMRERAGGVPSHSPVKAAIFLIRAMMALAIALTRPAKVLEQESS